MRFDTSGMFWEDPVKVRGKTERVRQIAQIPDSDWRPPTDFPNLSSAKIIGLDTETYDPNLLTHGPGWSRGDGEVIGVSLSADDQSWYFPIRHKLQPEMNMDATQVFRYLADTLKTNTPKVGANLQYDVGWLKQEGVSVKGMLYDVQFAEALLDDVARSYSLETLAQKYLGTGKVSAELYEWCAKSYGGKPTGKQRANMYRSPVTLVGPYAEADAHEPLEILNRQHQLLIRDGLWDLFELECRLIPLLVDMRFRGMHVDLEKAELVRQEMQLEESFLQDKLDAEAGFNVNVYGNEDLVRLFDSKKVSYPRTEKGNASFTQVWLDANRNTFAQSVNDIRKLRKSRVTFIENGIIEKNIDGFVHPSFHPLRGEDGGAVSGRLSSSNPNAQQIPSRNKILAPKIRGLYIPEEGYDQWLKLDLSQIEYRLFAHYSQDEFLINEYQKGDTDYHAVVSDMLGGGMPRPIVKNFNFMSLYGGGKKKTISMVKANMPKKDVKRLCAELGITSTANALGEHFVKLYAKQFPAAKETMDRISAVAESTGEIRTILNRRNTFELWEPANKYGCPPLSYERAREMYGFNIKRALTYRALNRKLQGSAADLLKKGMVDAYEQGLFKNIGVPHVTVHDEIDFSYHNDLRADALAIKQCIERAIPLKVPVIMDAESGPDWGHVKDLDLGT